MGVFPVLPKTYIPAIKSTVCSQTVIPPIRGIIDTLPIEVLGEIFVHCLPRSNIAPPIPTLQTAPLQLCHVSSRWKRIAMSMPSLWTMIILAPMPNVPEAAYLSMIAMFIDLSKSRPLRIDISMEEDDDLEILIKGFSLILPEIDRWKYANIIMSEEICELLVGAPVGPKPLLEELFLDMLPYDQRLEDADHLPATFSKFPRLHVLKLYPDFFAPFNGIPWSQLIDIYICTGIPIDEVFEILGQCRRLVRCVLGSVIEPTSDTKPYDVVLPSLASLQMRLEWDVTCFLSCLTCPALVQLSLGCSHAPPIRAPNVLKKFLSRSSCKLEEFHWKLGGVAESEIIDCMKMPALQHVKTLIIHSLDLSISTIKLLTHEDNETTTVFMPFLEELRLGFDNIPDGLVSDMVLSRYEAPGRGTTATSTKKPVNLKYVEMVFGQFERFIHGKLLVRSRHRADIAKLGFISGDDLKIILSFATFIPSLQRGGLGGLGAYEYDFPLAGAAASEALQSILVPGNHEPYRSTLTESRRRLREFSALHSAATVTPEKRRSSLSRDVPLWSAIDPEHMGLISTALNDFKHIRYLDPETYGVLHQEERIWSSEIIEVIKAGEPQRRLTMFTHHALTLKDVSHSRYYDGPSSSAFATELTNRPC
ncbi:hypothetical protein BDZ94DRAFT_1306919 [Collybia nuda]|uniref:F-box domain-containing protein n=1 Tax=Collybia nuda TaxID=64659 RepID=A0A9P6CKP9_9AGAR|nr:hypothetical protein BDZ94DRAFT_1306919 [Collybia nuda]